MDKKIYEFAKFYALTRKMKADDQYVQMTEEDIQEFAAELEIFIDDYFMEDTFDGN